LKNQFSWRATKIAIFRGKRPKRQIFDRWAKKTYFKNLFTFLVFPCYTDVMKKICKVSGREFKITQEDFEFYKKLGITTDKDLRGLPTLCPAERSRQRMAWANQINLYHRNCSATGKKIISNFSPDKPFVVYDLEYYVSDHWDGKDYARDFDFSRPFFEQWYELFLATPKQALLKDFINEENSAFCNSSSNNKDCYLVFDSDFNRDCYYSYSINSSTNVVDCFRVDKCELCYECIDCVNCYHSVFLQNSENCSDSAFLKNCIGCKNCFGSINLRNKEFYFLNQKCSKAQYEQKLKDIGIQNFSKLKNLRGHFTEHCKKFPHKFMQGVQNENVLGNYLTNCKNAFKCFDSRNLWDCSYIEQAFDTLKDSQDCTEVGIDAELSYECCYAGVQFVNNRFCTHCFILSDSDYCHSVHHSKNCFGCCSLTKAEYCILNKQYSKEEYFELKSKIIEHMKKKTPSNSPLSRGEQSEWGEFFPIEMSPFGYNESVAMEYFPLEKQMAEKLKYNWYDGLDLMRKGKPTNYEIPDNINMVADDVLKQVLTCEKCQKNYKIIKQELKFYRQMNIPIPHKCFHCRHNERRNMRNPRKLWERTCDNSECKTVFQTSFSPDQPEKVYCEKCYLEEVN